TLVNAGKAIIAYDTWGEDKSKAAGMATFNVVSAIVGTKGAGSGLRGGGAAVEASRFATVARAGTGLVRAGEFVGRLPTVETVVGSAAQRIPGLRIPRIDIPEVDAPTVHVDTPEVRTPHVDAPRVETPDVNTPRADAPQINPPHVETPDVRSPDVETPAHVPYGPGVGDAVARTPDSPRLDVPETRMDAEQPVAVGAGRAGGEQPVDAPADTTPDSTPDGAEQSTDGTLDPADGPDAPPDRPELGTQPDGRWVGEEHDVRLELDPNVNTAADDLIRHAAEAERTITPDVRAVVGGVDEARLRGHDYVLKSENSLKRKLATEFERFPDLDASDTPGLVRDSVRYTMEIPPGSYVDGVAHAVADLQARGFQNVGFKPTWDNPGGYKGVNTNWLDPRTGQVFELQFHTPDSFVAKMDTHPYYEAMRVPGVSVAEVARLADEQAAIFGRVDVPAGVDRLHGIRDALESTRDAGAREVDPVGGTLDSQPPGANRNDVRAPSSVDPAGGAQADHGSGAVGGAGLPVGAADPFDTLPPGVRQTLIESTVADSGRKFPLTDGNAEAMLRGGPPGTIPVVAGPGAPGADVRFVDADGGDILRREHKSIGGGYNSFNTELAHAAKEQLAYRGEVWVQVRPGTDVETWIRKWQGSRSADRLADYLGMEVVFRDSDGAPLGTYRLGDRLPPR
ncbi:MAG: hypothetical protein LH603_10615, partial [Pseudonocardia sp.]|nr:hypothetical protein [Pseudonocardia sp.]